MRWNYESDNNKTKKDKDGIFIMEVTSFDVGAEQLRLGDIELSQRKYEQRTLEDTS